MSKRQEEAHDSPFDMQGMFDMNGSGLEFAERTYRAWVENAGRLQNETLGFLNERFEKNVAAARELSACKTPTEYFEVQARYADRAMADWIAQGQKVMRLVNELTSHAAQPMQQAAEETVARARNGRVAH